ncbi:MAG: ATP-binding protein [Thermodesulfobacteriota bacterium]|jgi:signal transduction histidine kinase
MSDPLVIFIVYLLYGLAFFAMGIAVVSRDTRSSNLSLAPLLWLFAVFAFTHAFHEWSELYLILQGSHLDPRLLLRIKGLKLWPVVASYFFLLLFGIFLLGRVYPRQRNVLLLVVPLLLFGLLATTMASAEPQRSVEFLQYHNFRIRNFLGFPAGIAAGLGFAAYASTVQELSPRGARSFRWAGAFLVVYGVLTGLVPSRTLVPLFGQVEVLRGLSAVAILHFLMRGLHVFDAERRVAIEDRLRRFAESEKTHALGKLASGIAHEINNPLGNVSLSVELLKKDLSGVAGMEGTARRFALIERNLDRASKIARELLYVSRSQDAEAVEADLNEVIRGALTLLGPGTDECPIELRPGPLPPLHLVPWKVEEVFLNLLLNARDAAGPGGKIVISTAAKNGEVVAEVADTGPGIAPEDVGRIFDPFFTTKEVGRGTGLGLSVSRGIMERHGGRIEVARTGPGGTVMAVVFPVRGAAHA